MPHRPIRSLIKQQKILFASPQTTVLHAARQMRDKGLGTILITDGDKLLGIFTERDALNRVMAEGRDPKITLLAHVMTADPLTIHPDKPFGQALQLMFERGFRHVPVVENGKPIGIVSVRDALSGDLREVETEQTQDGQTSEALG